MVAVKAPEAVVTEEKPKEQFEMPTGTHTMVIAPIIEMVKNKKAENINFETLPSYTAYLGAKTTNGALLKLYFKNYHVESMYDHVRHFHGGNEQFTNDQHRLVEEWKTVRHPLRGEENSDHIKRIDAFSALLNSLFSRMGAPAKKAKSR